MNREYDFNHLIDSLLEILSEDDKYDLNFIRFLREYMKLNLLTWEEDDLFERVLETGLVYRFTSEDRPHLTYDIRISRKGLKALKEYGTYDKYREAAEKKKIKHEKQLKRLEFHDRLEKISKPWLAIITAVLATISLICSIIALKRTGDSNNSGQKKEVQSNTVEKNKESKPLSQSLKDSLPPVKSR